MNERKHLNLIAFATAMVLLCSSYAFAGLVPDTGDPDEAVCNPKSYTDLGNGIIQDDVTGLMWQQATAPGTYTWEAAVAYPDTLTLGTYSDWRLPTIKELSYLINTSLSDPAINTSYFPGTFSDYYWSSNTHMSFASNAWVMDFGWGMGNNVNQANPYYVRAVRGAVSTNNDFVDNNDGTITDSSTGLMWQKATAPGTYTWQEAVDYSDNLTLGTYSDWRLPTRNELHSIVDYSSYNPSIDTAFFPDTQSSYYWASTANYSSSAAVVVLFSGGDVGGQSTGEWNAYYVRAVRAGQCGPLETTTTTSVGATTTTSVASSSTTTSIGGITTTTTVSGGVTTTTTTTGGKSCPAKKALGVDNPKLENLRTFRDSRLAHSAVGRRIIKIYYNNADSINAALDNSPALRAVARKVLEVIAPMVGNN